MRSMNPIHKASTLRLYALGLLLVGLASVFYNAKEGTVQWHGEGKTGLIANGIGAVLAVIFSLYAAKGKVWAHWAGAILCFMLLIVGFNKGFLTVREMSAETAKQYLWFKATILLATGFLSLIALMPLLIYLRRERPLESDDRQ